MKEIWGDIESLSVDGVFFTLQLFSMSFTDDHALAIEDVNMYIS